MKHLVGGLFLSGVVAFGLLTGCYQDDSTVGGDDPDNGAECGVIGERVTQADGCTECTCTEMGWSCDDSDCEMSCMEGATRPGGDGCNTCYCSDGTWSCTLLDCQPQCAPGETQSDGCNSCHCSDDGTWSCTTMYCPPKCTEGEVRDAGDGCNTCTCVEEGNWSCTMKSCSGCGFLDQAAPDPCNDCSCLEDGTVVCMPIAAPGCNDDCPPPQMRDGDASCPAVSGVARNPTTGTCCEYGTACLAPDGWQMFDTLDQCQGLVCMAGTADCDGDPSNGCEINIDSDPENCGACGSMCMTAPDTMVACSAGECQLTSITRDTCVYGGVEYQPGAEFPSRDGCNTCSCIDETGPTASIACTDAACACDPESEPYRNYVTQDPGSCSLVDFACTGNTTAFFNDCGCGCEQSSECPDSMDCTPMSTTCNEPLAARCPYTVVAR